MSQIISRREVVDINTGEMETITTIISGHIGGKWMRVLQSEYPKFSRTPLRGETYKVLMYIVFNAGWGNTMPSQKKMSIALEMKQPHVSRALKQLRKTDLLVTLQSQEILNPVVFWKGSAAKRKELLGIMSNERLEEQGVKL